jgi:hypothetical protein
MQFATAVDAVRDEEKAEAGEEVEEKILEWTIAGQEFRANLPTTTQMILLSTTAEADGGTLRAMINASLQFLEGIMLDDSYPRFRRLMSKGIITQGLLIGGDGTNEQGVIDWIVSQVSGGRPTQPSADSSPSQKPAGTRSTGRAPGKGSIQSASPQPGS